MFQLLDGFLYALNNGRVLRGLASKALLFLSWSRLVFAFLVPLVSITGLRSENAKTVIGILLTGVCWGAWLYAGACISNFRSRMIAGLSDTPRMASWIWVNLLRMFAEEVLALCTVLGATSFLTVGLMGGSSQFAIGILSELAIVGGFVALLGFGMLGVLLFVALTLVADIVSASIETADSLRTLLRTEPSAAAATAGAGWPTN